MNVVSTARNVTLEQELLVRNYTLTPPYPIPESLLEKGSAYAFSVTLCNFLGACGSSTARVQVLHSLLPSVSLRRVTAVGTRGLNLDPRRLAQLRHRPSQPWSIGPFLRMDLLSCGHLSSSCPDPSSTSHSFSNVPVPK